MKNKATNTPLTFEEIVIVMTVNVIWKLYLCSPRTQKFCPFPRWKSLSEKRFFVKKVQNHTNFLLRKAP